MYDVLTCAEGYLELGMLQDAWEELHLLPEAALNDTPAMRLRLGIATQMKAWPVAVATANRLLARGDCDPNTIILGAYATRRCEGSTLRAAKEYLLQGAGWMQECSTYHFNLACYECQLHDLPAARALLHQAYALEPRYRVVALAEEDLKPLWAEIAAHQS